MEDGAVTIDHGGMTITSVGVSEADAKASLAQEHPDEPAEGKPDKPAKAEKPAKLSPSDHARELGKRGGKAAAAARAEAKPEEKPEKLEPGAKPAPAKEKSAGEEVEPDEPDEDDDAPLSKRAQRRVEVATRKQAEARREAAEAKQALERERARYEAELAEARRGRGDAKEPDPRRRADGPQDPRTASDGRPREEDFEKFSDYLDARDEYNRKEWERDHQRRQHAEREVTNVQSYVQDFVKHVPKEMLSDLDPELVEMKPIWFLGDDEPIQIENLVATEILYLRDKAPAVLKHLSDHPEEIARLKGLRNHPDVRLEVQLLARTLGSRSDATAGDPPDSGEQAPKPARSKANPPVRPVTGAPHVADGDPTPRPEEENDFDAWYRRNHKKRA